MIQATWDKSLDYMFSSVAEEAPPHCTVRTLLPTTSEPFKEIERIKRPRWFLWLLKFMWLCVRCGPKSNIYLHLQHCFSSACADWNMALPPELKLSSLSLQRPPEDFHIWRSGSISLSILEYSRVFFLSLFQVAPEFWQQTESIKIKPSDNKTLTFQRGITSLLLQSPCDPPTCVTILWEK